MVNKLYTRDETAIDWLNTGGAELMDLGGLISGGVVMGSFADLGATPRSEFYKYEFIIDGFDTAPVVGQSVHIYLSFSDAETGFDGKPDTDPTTTVEGVFTSNQLRNLLQLDAATVYSTTTTKELKVSGTVRIAHRYVSPVVQNNTADALESTGDAHKFVLTPIPPELQ